MHQKSQDHGVCIQEGVLPNPLNIDPLDADHPGCRPLPRDAWDTMGYSQQACGTYPTGMHSCFAICAIILVVQCDDDNKFLPDVNKCNITLKGFLIPEFPSIKKDQNTSLSS